MDAKSNSIKEAAFIAGVYATASIIWIIVSDYIVIELAKSAFLSMAKGIGFVLVTAAMLFFMTYRFIYGLRKKQAELFRINKTLETMVAEEISKSREKDIELIKQTRAAEIGGMIGSIAHHWRQPLNIIGIIVQDIRNRYVDNELSREKIDEMTATATKHINAMSETIDDFYSLYETGEQKRHFGVKHNIEQAVAIVKPVFDNIGIKLYMEVEDASVAGYERAFCRAITNILMLSIDSFGCNDIENKRVAIVGKVNEGVYRLALEDNSAIKDISVIENDIFSVKHNSWRFGIGLGLFVAKLVIEQNMGGVVKVDTSSVGMLFTIEIKI